MIFEELGASDRFVSTELVVGVVERCEHLKEAKSGLLDRLGSSDHIWVSRWVKVVFYFFKLKCAVSIGIKLIKCFIYKAFTEGIQLTAKSCQKFVEADLTVSTLSLIHI